tara:strand:- start:247 stop:726 length:480 start_codon:yes stop_codon:yes gene_type:complete
MKNLFNVSIFLGLFVACETAPKTNGFVTSIENSSWQMGSQASVDLVTNLDEYWGVDFDQMRTFFADSVYGRFAEGESFENVDEFLEIVKDQMQSSPGEQNWNLDWAFCIDLDPSSGGDWVNAAFTVAASGDKPKRHINEWYFVKDGKIHRFNQSRRLLE